MSAVSPLRSASDEPAHGGDLLDEIEPVAVRGQHRDARLGGNQENQRVVQAFVALVRLETLRAREQARDHPGIHPHLRVGRQQPARRDGREQLAVTVPRRRPAGSRRIGVGDTDRSSPSATEQWNSSVWSIASRTGAGSRPAAWSI